jgi:hypothetical protein
MTGELNGRMQPHHNQIGPIFLRGLEDLPGGIAEIDDMFDACPSAIGFAAPDLSAGSSNIPRHEPGRIRGAPARHG